MDDDHRGVLGDRHTTVTDDLNDLMTDASRGHHTNDLLDDHSMGGKKSHRVDLSIDPECYVLGDRRMNVKDDRNDLKMDVMTDVNLCLRKSGRLDDRNLDASRVNRNCVHHDLNLDGKMDGMSHHGMWMGDLNMNCDRMSHDHLQCDHLR
jgi:hypothetical protein